jgi:LuxR family transcriptional regulator, maltose regulon positive regulatory protein
MVATKRLGEPQSFPLLVTKLHPPLRREQTVARHGLIEKLRPEPGVKLTVVAAPAGSGKTTLLGAWREIEHETHPVAWLSLDEGDNDPVVLWTYLLAALKSVVPALELRSAPEVVGAAGIMDSVLPELINELAAIDHVGLVLDDFHRLSNGPARDSIGWFVDHAPANFRLVLATRRDTGLPVATLRAHGALLELRAADLAFTSEDADDLLNDRLSLGLPATAIRGLVERTEGWAAGLYLAALSLQAVDDREELIARFGGRSRHVVDFLVDEVLGAHDADMQQLMLRASVLERLCGPLCDAVLGQEGSDTLLEALSRANMFLIPLDDQGTWYRFHHLFAQLLRVELEHREPDIVPTLNLRAFEWYRDQGSLDEAVTHALRADAHPEAAEVLAERWSEYLRTGRHATVLAWLRQIPPELLDGNAVLLLVQAWTLSLDGQAESTQDAIEALERLKPFDPGPLPDGFSSVEASLATLRGLIPRGDIGGALEHARRAAELEGPESPWRPLVCDALGTTLYFSGENSEAARWLSESPEPALARGHWRIAVSSLSFHSLVAGELGSADEQTQLADRALDVAGQHGLEDVDPELHLALGASFEARGRRDEALAALERCVLLSRRGDYFDVVAIALIRQAALLRAMGRRSETAPLIEEARALVAACPDPRIIADELAKVDHEPPAARPRPDDDALSARELVVLKMLGGRLSEKDIGRELYLSHNTIHSHTKSIYRKLNASSRSEALRNARELGLI